MTISAEFKKQMRNEIYTTIRTACMAMVEELPQAKQAFERHYELVESIKPKVSRENYIRLQDAILDGGVLFGHEMFRLGLELGRNPQVLFDLINMDDQEAGAE